MFYTFWLGRNAGFDIRSSRRSKTVRQHCALMKILAILFMLCGGLHAADSTNGTVPANLNTTNDPIDKLISDIKQSSHGAGRFPNGIWNYTILPATATPEQLVSQIGRGICFGELNTTHVQILESRKFRYFFDENTLRDTVYCNPDYVAVLVKTDCGKKIVLANFARWRTNEPTWETRVYNAE